MCAMEVCTFKDDEDFPFYKFEHTAIEPPYKKKAYPFFFLLNL